MIFIEKNSNDLDTIFHYFSIKMSVITQSLYSFGYFHMKLIQIGALEMAGKSVYEVN